MKRNLSGALGALLLSGTLLGSLAISRPAQADFFSEVRRHGSTAPRGDFDRDGIPNYRDRDDDNDGIGDYRDRNDYSYRGRGYYRNGRYYSGRYYNTVPRRGAYGDLDRDGIRNRWDRDRDNDGRRNRRDDHPNNPRRH